MRNEMISRGPIERKIFMIRGHKVMLDSDLAELYGVETKALKRAVKRNADRFPGDFMFQLSRQDLKNLRYHFGTSSWGGQRYLPYAFTEQGVAMLSSVLQSKRAIHVNIAIMRAFVRLREILLAHKDLARRLDKLERKYDTRFRRVFDAIRELMAPSPAPPPEAEPQKSAFRTTFYSPAKAGRKRIGFMKERKRRYIALVRKNRVRDSYKATREERVLV